MDSSEYNTRRWLDMFETMCSRFVCRRVEDVSPTDFDLHIYGPGGVWLAEIVSVEFDDHGGLVPACKRSIDELASNVLKQQFLRANRPPSKQQPEPSQAHVVAIDWFIHHERPTANTRHQCLIRTCLNDALTSVIVLSNTTKHANLSPASLPFSRHSDRLRPFVFVLACELFYRRYDFEVLNLHYEPLDSSIRWRSGQRRWLQQHVGAERVAQLFASTSRPRGEGEEDELVCSSNGSGEGWLELAREMYRRGRFVRILHTRPQYELLDAILTTRSTSGRIRYVWRDGRSLLAHGTSPVARGTLLCLRDLDLEITRQRACLLSLCDYDVMHKRCGMMLLFEQQHFDIVSGMFVDNATSKPISEQLDVVEENRSISERDVQEHVRRHLLDESAYEKRYFIDHTGSLARKSSLRFS